MSNRVKVSISLAYVLFLPGMSQAQTLDGFLGLDWKGSLDFSTNYISYYDGNVALQNPYVPLPDYFNKGKQVWAPLTISTIGRNDDISISISGRGSFIYSNQFTSNTIRPGTVPFIPGIHEGEVIGLTDTSFQTQIQFLQNKKFVPYVLFGFNAPTGHSDISYAMSSVGKPPNVYVKDEAVSASVLDPVYLTQFGEGWNGIVGAGFSAALADRLSFSLGGSYIVRGPYRSSHPTDGTDLDAIDIVPGSQVTANTSLRYTLEKDSFTLSLDYRHENPNLSKYPTWFDNLYHPGDVYSTNLSYSHQWNDRNATTISFLNSKALEGFSENLGVIGFNETRPNSDRYQYQLTHNLQASDRLTLEATGTFRFQTETTGYMEGIFIKDWSDYTLLGNLAGSYKLTPKLTATASVGGFYRGHRGYDNLAHADYTNDASGFLASTGMKWEW